MVEDTPHDLVHDLAAEAVFGAHPLGRPVIGRAEVISTVSRRALAAYHRRAYVGERIVLAAAGNVRHDGARVAPRGATERRRAGAGLAAAQARAPVPGSRALRFQRKDTEQYHVCLSAPGHRARRRAPFRRLDPGRDRRRLGVVAALPGDPREARDGVLRVQLLVAVRGHGSGRPLRRHARGEPRRLPRDRGRGARRTSRAATCAPTSSRARRRTSRAASSCRSSRRRPG